MTLIIKIIKDMLNASNKPAYNGGEKKLRTVIKAPI